MAPQYNTFRLFKVYGYTSGFLKSVAPGVEAGILLGRREDLEIATGYVFGRTPVDRDPGELGMGRHVIMVHIAGGGSVPEHSHPFDQLSVVVRGRLEVCVEGECHMLKPGDSIYIPGGLRHYSKAHSSVIQIEARYNLRESNKTELAPWGTRLELKGASLHHLEDNTGTLNGKWILATINGTATIGGVELGGVVVAGEGQTQVEVNGKSILLRNIA